MAIRLRTATETRTTTEPGLGSTSTTVSYESRPTRTMTGPEGESFDFWSSLKQHFEDMSALEWAEVIVKGLPGGENPGGWESATEVLQRFASAAEKAQAHYEGVQEGRREMFKETVNSSFDSKSSEDIQRDNEAGERLEKIRDGGDPTPV